MSFKRAGASAIVTYFADEIANIDKKIPILINNKNCFTFLLFLNEFNKRVILKILIEYFFYIIILII